MGFDVHAFGPGDHVWLGGVRIPHERGLRGHSDADVALHALTDALLGAIAAGDIGDHFPPSDPQWKGAPSSLFLEHARDLVTGAGGRIVHADVTIICEAPRIGPHRDAMRQRIAALLRLPATRVSVKATTTERLGFTGRGEGHRRPGDRHGPDAGDGMSEHLDFVLPQQLVDLARRVVEENRAAGRRVAAAESCTGGLVAAALTEIPGSSDVFEVGLRHLFQRGEDASCSASSMDVIETFGSVSVAVAWAMAQGALRASGADVAVAMTGIAGPGGGSDRKPVGRSSSRGPSADADPKKIVADTQVSAISAAAASGFRRRFARWSCCCRTRRRRRAPPPRSSNASIIRRSARSNICPASASKMRLRKAKSTQKSTSVPPGRRRETSSGCADI